MKFRLEIKCDGAAFEPSADFEVVCMLRRLADQIEHPEPGPWPIYDVYGNDVGWAAYEEEKGDG
jgi:hypothetical protein